MAPASAPRLLGIPPCFKMDWSESIIVQLHPCNTPFYSCKCLLILPKWCPPVPDSQATCPIWHTLLHHQLWFGIISTSIMASLSLHHIASYSEQPLTVTILSGVWYMSSGQWWWYQRFRTVTLGPDCGPNRLVVKLAVHVIKIPKPSTQVEFDGSLPRRLNWAGCQWVAQQVPL